MHPLMSRFLLRLFAAAAVAVAVVLPASAQLYSCKDADGKKIYTTEPDDPNCVRRKSYEKNAAPAPAPAPVPADPPAPVPKKVVPAKPQSGGSQKKFVPTATQKQRLDKRAEILVYELRREELLLEHVNARIAATPADKETTLAHLRRQQRIHLLNLRAIQQELARL